MGHEGLVQSLAFSMDGRWLVSQSTISSGLLPDFDFHLTVKCQCISQDLLAVLFCELFSHKNPLISLPQLKAIDQIQCKLI